MNIICHFSLKITRNFGLSVAVTKMWRMECYGLIFSCALLTCYSQSDKDIDINEVQFVNLKFLFYKVKKIFIIAIKHGSSTFSYSFYLFKYLYDGNYKQFVYSVNY